MRVIIWLTAGLIALNAIFVTMSFGKREDAPALTIKLLTPEILIGEPIIVELKIYNPTDEPIKLQSLVFGVHGNASIHFSKPGYSITALPLPGAYAIPIERPLMPKQVQVSLMNLDTFTQPEQPGKYTVQVIYFSGVSGLGTPPPPGIWKGKVISNTEFLLIHKPKGVDAEVFKLLISHHRAVELRHIYGSDLAEEISVKYPQSQYVRYCLFYLGLRYLYRQWEKGMAYLRKVTTEYPDHWIAHLAQLSIVSELLKKQRFEEAEKELRIFFHNFPESKFTQWANELKAVLERKRK